MPRCWPGFSVVCVATGPSLDAAQVDAVRAWRDTGTARAIVVVNDAYVLAPWADVLYACDGSWWEAHAGAPSFRGQKVSGTRHGAAWGAQCLVTDRRHGLSDDPTTLAGSNSGYQAMNFAVLSGASRVVLLGYDCRPSQTGQTHFFGSHRHASHEPPFGLFLGEWPSACQPLEDAGVSVVNATPDSAITCFPTATLTEALCSTR